MSNIGKIGFLLAALCLVVVAAIRFILGAWIPFLYLLVALAGVALIVSFISDRKLYLEFFTLRTTKHGMNMGVLILLVLGFLVCVNYVSVRHNKTWDLTQEKLNSLSDQSKKVLSSLKSDVTVKIFYKGSDALGERQQARQAFEIYQENSSHFKVDYINAYVNNMLAQEYLASLPDRDQQGVFVFIDHDGKKIRVQEPYGEEQITQALVKATRRGERKIYFIEGHGERELDSESQQGLKAFKQEMESASYQVATLNLYDKAEIPGDAAMVAIIGPKQPYLDNEIAVLKKYVQGGGKLLLALDPGENQNLSQLARQLGVDFKNNYVINLDPLTRQASATALGIEFDRTSPITSPLLEGKTLTLFDLSSELEVEKTKDAKITVTPLVKSAPTSFVMNELKKAVINTKDQNSYPLYMFSKGTLEGDGAKEFTAVVVGDSDFFTNRFFLVGSNRDLAMNTLASLTDQGDLISIRPKVAKGTKVLLTSADRLGMIVAGVSLPVLLLLLSGLFWYQRRST
jgi:ABC-type uncharacterized transport system involved in gliding motility auxiliary subunit